jgi:hypothetical protein
MEEDARWRSGSLRAGSASTLSKGSRRSLGRTPRVGMAEDASSGSFDALSVARDAGFFVFAQDESFHRHAGRRSPGGAVSPLEVPTIYYPLTQGLHIIRVVIVLAPHLNLPDASCFRSLYRKGANITELGASIGSLVAVGRFQRLAVFVSESPQW